MFITFEGGEGTGKSTQVKLLAERFRTEGKTVLTTREPGGTPEAEAIRNLMVLGDPGRWSGNEEMLLAFAARNSHIRHVVEPTLKTGAIVICDRFVDSSYVYQVVAGGADKILFSALQAAVSNTSIPDFTFILDIDHMIGSERAHQRMMGGNAPTENRFERKGATFHEKVRAGFVEISKLQPARCHLIDAAASESEVADRIWAKLHA